MRFKIIKMLAILYRFQKYLYVDHMPPTTNLIVMQTQEHGAGDSGRLQQSGN